MNKLIRQAFTLIELLVVIAIIGILSGLIFVSMGGMTQKATIAKAQVFSNSLRNSLMMDILAEWKFDIDGRDSWGSNSGTLVDSTIVNSNCLRGSCLNLTGTITSCFIENPYAGFPVNEFTFEAWVKTSDTKSSGIVSYATTHSDNEFLLINPSALELYIFGNSRGLGIKMNDNYWHNIVVSWNTSGAVKTYLDGALKDSGSFGAGSALLDTGSIVLGQDQDGVGGSYDVTQSYVGLIDEVRLYRKVIPAFLIKQNYYLGLNSLLDSGRITNDDYFSRFNSIAQK